MAKVEGRSSLKELAPPSPHLLANQEALDRAARLGPIADLACGRGRHALVLARRGLSVVGLDRSREFLSEFAQRARAAKLPVDTLRCDLEGGLDIPLRAGSCGAVLVYRFLFRPLAPAIEVLLAPGGLLLYETFTVDQLELGYGPSSPAFLLQRGELPRLFPGLEIEAYDESLCGGERPEALARLRARKP